MLLWPGPRLLLAAALVAAGCAVSAPQIRDVRPPSVGALDDRVTLQLRLPSETHYDRRSAVVTSGDATLVLPLLAAAAESLGRTALESDRQINRAALEICRGLRRSGPPSARLVDFALRSAGMTDPPPHLLVVELPQGGGIDVSQLRERLLALLKQGAYRRVGVARCQPQLTPDRWRLVIALCESPLRFQPLPRSWQLGRSAELRLRTLAGHRDLRLVYVTPAGRIVEAPMRAFAGGRFSAPFGCGHQGMYRVEITGIGRLGTEVLANFPIYCAVRPPHQVSYQRSHFGVTSRQELERRIADLVDEQRRRVGLADLVRLDNLSAVARRHSERMRDERFVGHVTPNGEQPQDRLRAANIAFSVARENVARAYSAEEAMSELMNSPAHRANILAQDIDAIGVGVAIERRPDVPVLFVSQEFIKQPLQVAPAEFVRRLLEAANRYRIERNVALLKRSERLDQLAAGYLLDGGNSNAEQARQRLKSAAQRLGRYRAIVGVLATASVPGDLARAAELVDANFLRVGFAARRGASGYVIAFVLAR
ncbi:MAG: hypothetical protein H6707_15775 [Deltaproteobacteria bacterium]|nr:hypothetical protein [Deltaproteobacteria bacterium]